MSSPIYVTDRMAFTDISQNLLELEGSSQFPKNSNVDNKYRLLLRILY